MVSKSTGNESKLMNSPLMSLIPSNKTSQSDTAIKTSDDLEKEEKLNKLIYILGSSEDKDEKMETLRLISHLCHNDQDDDEVDYSQVALSISHPAMAMNVPEVTGKLKEHLVDSIPLPESPSYLHNVPHPPSYPPPFSLPIPLPNNLPLDSIPIPGAVTTIKTSQPNTRSKEGFKSVEDSVNSFINQVDGKEEDLTAITKTRLGIVKLHTKYTPSIMHKTTSSFPAHKRGLDGLTKNNKHLKKSQNKANKQQNEVLKGMESQHIETTKEVTKALNGPVKNITSIDTIPSQSGHALDPIKPNINSHNSIINIISNNITPTSTITSTNNNNVANVTNAVNKSPGKVDNTLNNSNTNVGVKKLDIQQRISEWKQELLRDMSRGRFRGAKEQTIISNEDQTKVGNDATNESSLPDDDSVKILNKTFVEVKSFSDLKTYKWPIEMVKHTSGSNALSYSCNPLFFDFLRLEDRVSLKSTKGLFGKDEHCSKRLTCEIMKNKGDFIKVRKRLKTTDGEITKMETGFDDDLNSKTNAAKWDTSEESEIANCEKSNKSTKKVRKSKSNRIEDKDSSSSNTESYFSSSSRSKSYSRRKRRERWFNSSCSRSGSSCSSYSSRSYSRESSYSSESRHSSKSKSRGSYRRYQRKRKNARRRSRSRSFSRLTERNFMKRVYKICPPLPKIIKKSNSVDNNTKTNSSLSVGKPMIIQSNEACLESSLKQNSRTCQIPLPKKQLSQEEKFQHIGPDDPLVFKTTSKSLSEDSTNTSATGNVEYKKDEEFVIPPEQLEKYKLLRMKAERHAKKLKGEGGIEEDIEENHQVAMKEETSKSATVVKEYKSGNSDPQMQLVEELYLKQMAAIMSSHDIRQHHPHQLRHPHKVGFNNLPKNRDMMHMMGGNNALGPRMLCHSSNNFYKNRMMNSQAFHPLMQGGSPVGRKSLFLRPRQAKSTMNIRADFKSKPINSMKVKAEVKEYVKQSSQVFESKLDKEFNKKTSEASNPQEKIADTTSESLYHQELEKVVSSNTQHSIVTVSEDLPQSSNDPHVLMSSNDSEVSSTVLSSLNTTLITPNASADSNINLAEMNDCNIQHLLLGDNLVKSSIGQQDFIRIVQLPSQHQLLQQQQHQQQLQLLQQRQLQIQQQQQLQLNLQLQQQQQLQYQQIQSGNIILASPIQHSQISVPIINRQGMIIGTARKQPTLVQMPAGQLITPTIISGQPMILGSSGQVLLPRFIR